MPCQSCPEPATRPLHPPIFVETDFCVCEMIWKVTNKKDIVDLNLFGKKNLSKFLWLLANTSSCPKGFLKSFCSKKNAAFFPNFQLTFLQAAVGPSFPLSFFFSWVRVRWLRFMLIFSNIERFERVTYHILIYNHPTARSLARRIARFSGHLLDRLEPPNCHTPQNSLSCSQDEFQPSNAVGLQEKTVLVGGRKPR